MDNFTNVEQVVNDIRSKYNLPSVNLPAPAFSTQNNFGEPSKYRQGLQKAFQPKQFTAKESIDLNTNYTRLNSGDWIPKYENVLGNINNEERLALQQSWGEQWFNGITKNLTKAANYAVDATAGTAVGLFNLATGEGLTEAFDNDVSRWIDDLNTQLDADLPNYYTEAQKNMNVFQSLGTANFWANDVAGGLAFIGGNLISEAAIGVLTGGASLATTLPRIGLKLGAKSTAKQLGKLGLKNADDLLGSGVRNIGKKTVDLAKKEAQDKIVNESYKNLLRSTTLGKVGKGLDIGAFAVRSSTFEAGMEARQALKESIDTYVANYQAANGTDPSFEEMATFMNDAKNSANYVFMGNLAVLAPSNLLMFGKLSGVGAKLDKSFNNFGNKLIGVGRNTNRLETGIKEVVTETGKFGVQKNLGRAYKLLGGATTEGLFEEGLQGVASGTMKDYLEDKYNPNGISNEFGFWNSLAEAAHEQYTSKEGWKEMFIGALIGGIGGPAMQSKPKDFIKQVKSNFTLQDVVTDNQKATDALNEAHTKQFRRMNSGVALKNSVNKLYQNIEGSDVTNSNKKSSINYNKALTYNKSSNYNWLKVVSGIKTESEVMRDYDHMVDNMKVSDEVMTETGMSIEDVQQYKEDLKTNFRQEYKDFNKAKNAVKSLQLNAKIEDSKGNIIEVEDVLAHTVFMGMQSVPMAREVASQLDQALNSTGIYNPLQFYSELSEENRNLISELKSLQADIVRNDDSSRKLAEERLDEAASLAYAKNVEPRNVEEDFGKNVDVQISEQEIERIRAKEQAINKSLVGLRKESEQKQERVDELKSILGNSLKTTNFGIGNSFGATLEGLETMELDTMLQQIDDIDTFVETLKKEGKTKEAREIEELLLDFKFHSNNNREFQKLYRSLLDPRFFKTKGGKGLINNILGDKHELSEDTLKKIRENDDRILNSLRLNGIEFTGTAEEAVKKSIQDNSNLSEREKFRAEAILRASMMQSFILDATNSAEDVVIEDVVETTTSGDLGQPDSVDQVVRAKQQEDTRTNSEQLKDIINNVIGEINKILKLSPDSDVIISRKDVKRLNELIRKEQSPTESLTQEEIDEMRNLQNAFDQWTMIDGTMINKVPLSDLMKRLALYEETAVNKKTDIFNIENFESLALEEFSQRTNEPFYNILQSYFTTTSIKDKDGNITIQGVTLEKFAEELGHQGDVVENEDGSFDIFIPAEPTNLEVADKISEEEYNNFINNGVVSEERLRDIANKIITSQELSKEEKEIFYAKTGEINSTIENIDRGTTPIRVTKNDRGNIVIKPNDINVINSNTNIVIKPTNLKLSTNYSMVLKRGEGGVLLPLQSDFGDFTKGFMDEKAVYELNPNDEVTLTIDSNDAFNKKLIAKVKMKKVSENREIEIEEETQIEANKQLKSDQEYTNLLKERKQALKERDKERLKQIDILLRVKEDMTFDNIFNSSLRKETLPKLSPELRQEFLNNFVVQISDSNGRFVGVLKGKHEDGTSNANMKFEAIRQALIDEYLEEAILNPGTPIEIGKVPVTSIYLGHPSYNFTETTESLGTEFKDFTERDLTNIVDIGYVQGSTNQSEVKINLKNETKGVDTTFIKNVSKEEGNTPIIIVNFEGKKVAYPVRMKQLNIDSSIQEMEQIFNEKLDPITKAMRIDKILASLGININEKGNSLEYFSEDNSNFTEENFNNLLAKVREKAYFYEINDWLIGDKSIESALSEAQINIDLAKPFHSPKITVNFDNVDLPNLKVKEKGASKNTNTNNQSGFAYKVKNNKKVSEEVEETKPNETC